MTIGLITGSAHGEQMRADTRDALLAASEMTPEQWHRELLDGVFVPVLLDDQP